MKKYDLVVVGGGFAGVGAAIAAAEEGCKVLIVEKGNALSGAAVNALVNPFMCVGPHIEYNGDKVSAFGGIFRVLHNKLVERGATCGTYGNTFLEEELKLIVNEAVLDAGVEILFHSYLYNVRMDGDRVAAISLATRGGPLEIGADYFIDATGDALLSYLAGCPTLLGRAEDNRCQPMTLCFRIGNVDMERYKQSIPRLAEAHKKAVEKGELINPRENILTFGYPVGNVLHMNTTRVVKHDPTDPVELSNAEILARRQVVEIYEFMKKHADGLENSFIMMTASEIGIRESRKIIGEYVLTGDDCMACRKFDDAVTSCNYCIDIHNPDGKGTFIYELPEGEYFTVPYRSLIPKGVRNMLVAGRCISSDQVAQSSFRIMPSVCCIGEAAGCAIAMAAKKKADVREVDVKELQSILKSRSCFVGV